MAQATHPPFQGFSSPNYTQVPDELFDDLLAELSGAELKVLLYVIRRTFGFKREADSISLSQMLHGITRKDGLVLDRGTGLSKPTLLQALRNLIERHVIIAMRRRSDERGDEPTVYHLNVAEVKNTVSEPSPVVKKLDQGVVKKSIPPVVKKSAPQDTVVQETVKQETEISNIRRFTPSGTQDVSAKNSQLEPLTNVLKRRAPQPTPAIEARQAVGSVIRELAQEFGDRAPVRSSTTRALHLFERSRLSVPAFMAALYEARAITKDKAVSSHGTPTRNKMSYFFAVLTDVLGFKETAAE